MEELSLRKASASKARRGLVIGCDTVVVLDGHILGKPAHKEEAEQMLKSLSGRVHEVYTGLCVLKMQTGEKRIGHRRTSVWMKVLSEKNIRDYIKTGEPLDKAGAYGIQELGARYIEQIHGDYFTVVGLPISLLADFLTHFGCRF